MPDLHPTPTRLALLAAIDAGRVAQDAYDDEPGEVWRYTEHCPWSGVRVTAQVLEMQQFGWCRPVAEDADFHVQRIELTDAGRAVRDAAA